MKLVLASSSPRRADLLDQLGLSYEVIPADIDESRQPGEPAAVYVERLACEKASAVAARDAITIGADTAVVHEGTILGKPAHPEEARSMLRRLEGERHEVFTGLAVSGPSGDVVSLVDVTDVTMTSMTPDEIATYVSSGEPMDKAGAYALQGVGARWVQEVRGSPFTVIGLPVHLLGRLVGRFELALEDLSVH